MIPLDHVCHGVSRALPQAFPTQPPNAVPNDASIPQNEPFLTSTNSVRSSHSSSVSKKLNLLEKWERTRSFYNFCQLGDRLM